jgi:hypothetical protein
MISLRHMTLVAPSQVDFSESFTILRLLEPVVRADYAGFATCHTVGRDDAPLGEDGDVKVFGKLDFADAAVASTMSSSSTSCISVSETTINDHGLTHCPVFVRIDV